MSARWFTIRKRGRGSGGGANIQDGEEKRIVTDRSGMCEDDLNPLNLECTCVMELSRKTWNVRNWFLAQQETARVTVSSARGREAESRDLGGDASISRFRKRRRQLEFRAAFVRQTESIVLNVGTIPWNQVSRYCRDMLYYKHLVIKISSILCL